MGSESPGSRCAPAEDSGTFGLCLSSSFEESGADFGIMIARMPQGHLHSGIIYRRASGVGDIGYLHVKWEDALGERWADGGVWASPFAERFGPPHLVPRFQEEIRQGVQRIRPEEVVGACCCVSIPARFPDAVSAGERVIEILDSSLSGEHAQDVRVLASEAPRLGT